MKIFVGEKYSDKFRLRIRLPRNSRDLLLAANLRHGTDGFTSPPKEGVLKIFSPLKIRRLRPGLNPRTWVPKASTLPLEHRSRFPKDYPYYLILYFTNTHLSLISVHDLCVRHIISTEFYQVYRNVTTACEGISVLHYVTTACEGISVLHYVTTACEGISVLHYVTIACEGISVLHYDFST